jgi:hypothetical protein
VIAVRTLTGLLLPLAPFCVIAASDVAGAASPSYCALYAREYATDTVQPRAAPGMLQSVQDQAYYRCLNLDEDPPLPKASAYFGTDVIDSAPVAPVVNKPAGGATPPTAPQPRPAPTRSVASASIGSGVVDSKSSPPAARTSIVAAPPPPQAPDVKPAETRSVASASTYRATYHGSGMTAWTPEWKTWCARNFPNSWDPATGTILNFGADRRELCK